MLPGCLPLGKERVVYSSLCTTSLCLFHVHFDVFPDYSTTSHCVIIGAPFPNCQIPEDLTSGGTLFGCVDPDAACVGDDGVTVEMMEACGKPFEIGEDNCNVSNNEEECGGLLGENGTVLQFVVPLRVQY